MNNLKYIIIISCFTLNSFTQNLNLYFEQYTNLGNGNYEYGAPTAYSAGDVTEDFGRRNLLSPGTLWHPGIDLSYPNRDELRDHLLNPVVGESYVYRFVNLSGFKTLGVPVYSMDPVTLSVVTPYAEYSEQYFAGFSRKSNVYPSDPVKQWNHSEMKRINPFYVINIDIFFSSPSDFIHVP